MKIKKLLKRNLVATICVGILFNPVITAYCASSDTTEMQYATEVNNFFIESASSNQALIIKAADSDVSKNPTIQLNIKDFYNNDKEYIGLQFNLRAKLYDKDNKSIIVNCGHYDTGDKSNIKVEIPIDLYNYYKDISFSIEPTNVDGVCYYNTSGGIKYKGEENESYDIFLEIYENKIMKGSLTLTPPQKLEYKIGEELDLTGGMTKGNGVIESTLYGEDGVWDDFGTNLSLKNIDAYNFDNSKPGEYVIKYKPRNYNSVDEYDLTVKPKDFTVTVVDSERTDGATAKISIVDADTAENIKDVKAILFKCANNKNIAPDKDEIIAMWDTSIIPERMFTETDFAPNKYYYIGFENIPDGYNNNIRMYNRGYHFSSEEYFNFENDKDNAVWTVKLKADEPTPISDDTFLFRLYGRYIGIWEQPMNIGIVEIKDSEGKTVNILPLDNSFSLSDGDYTATLNVISKDYICFSDKIINFTVKDGKTETSLDYNVERSNFTDFGNGDSNNDEIIDMADSVLIMQSLANPSKYGVNGTDEHHITEQGLLRADIDGNGVTNMDALTIQNYLLGNFKIK